MQKEETRNITVLFLFIQCICLIFSSFYARHCFSPSARMGRICYRNSSKQNRQIADSTYEKWKWKSLSCVHALWPHGSPWNFPGQNTGVGSLSLLQGTFPTQGSNPGLSHCRQILHQLSHKISPRILEWVAYPFSSGPSWPRNWTWVSHIAGRLFIDYAKAFDSKVTTNCGKFLNRWEYQTTWPASWEICTQVKKQ